MEPLKKVQVEGYLMFAEPQDLFGNLDELCYVSSMSVIVPKITNTTITKSITKLGHSLRCAPWSSSIGLETIATNC